MKTMKHCYSWSQKTLFYQFNIVFRSILTYCIQELSDKDFDNSGAKFGGLISVLFKSSKSSKHKLKSKVDEHNSSYCSKRQCPLQVVLEKPFTAHHLRWMIRATAIAFLISVRKWSQLIIFQHVLSSQIFKSITILCRLNQLGKLFLLILQVSKYDEC